MHRTVREPEGDATARPSTSGGAPGRRGSPRRGPGMLLAAGAAAVAVVLAGAGAALADPGATVVERWTPLRADSSAPPVASTFAAPNDVHVDADGSVLVADFAGNGVLRRSVDGVWSVVAPFGTGPRDMWNPSALATTADGRVLVAEAGRPALATVDPGTGDVTRQDAPPVRGQVSGLAVDGATVFAAVPGSGALWTAPLGSDTWTTVDGPWRDPSGVALSDDGTVLSVADAGVDDVWQVDRTTGSAVSLGFPGEPGSTLRGVAVDHGDVFVVDNGEGRVWARVQGSWRVAVSTAPDGSPLVNPTGVAVGADRSLVVADYNRQRILTAASSGRVVPAPTAAPTSVPTDTPTTTTPDDEPTTAPPVDATSRPSASPSASPSGSAAVEPTTSTTAGAGPAGAAPPGSGPMRTAPTRTAPTDGPDHARALAWTGSTPMVPALAVAGLLLLLGTAGVVTRRRRA